MPRQFLLILMIAATTVSAADKKPDPPPKLKTFKPGFNFFSMEQDVQLGKEAATQVEQQFEVINNPELNNFIRTIGKKLTSQPQAGNFPYSFKIVAPTWAAVWFR